jgi:hypothetical protein
MTYHSEVDRIATAVAGGANLHQQVIESDCVTNPGRFVDCMRFTNYADEYANLVYQGGTGTAIEDLGPENWEHHAAHVVFFAMCADVRERLHA